MMYVVPLSCQALCLAFWLLNVPFQATANSLKKKNPKTAKKTKKKQQPQNTKRKTNSQTHKATQWNKK